jgi:hypothetical protein
MTGMNQLRCVTASPRIAQPSLLAFMRTLVASQSLSFRRSSGTQFGLPHLAATPLLETRCSRKNYWFSVAS